MADLEASLRTYLIAQAGIKTAFGSSNTRIYIDRIDPKITAVYPFAILRTAAEAPDYVMSGETKDRALIQIDVYSTSKTTVNSGAYAIRTVLSGYKGTAGSVSIGSCFVNATRGGYDPDAKIFRRSVDYAIGLNG